MIWRSAYRTPVAYDLALPPFPGSAREGRHVLIGGFDLRAYREMGVWLRLMQADASEAPLSLLFIRGTWDSGDLVALESMLPPSLYRLTETLSDGEGAWREWVQPDGPERAFAAVVEGGRASLTMKGAPTEEAWDAFLEALRKGN